MTTSDKQAEKPVVDVTVVMPAMNRATMIGDALASIDTQSARPAAVIVVDDASTDQTVSVAEAGGAQVIALAANGGSGPARNIGIEAAQTEWIAFLDSDDTWLPTHLEHVLSLSQGRVLVGAPGINPAGRLIGNSRGRDLDVDARSLIIPGDLICTSGALVRRKALLDAGLFRPLRRAQDLDMWIRVLGLGSGLATGRPGFIYGVHDGQAVRDEDLTRRCYAQIIESCRQEPWFSPHDVDRAWARFRWDGLRAAHRDHSHAEAAYHLQWLISRPHTWPTLAKKLAERRQSRTGARSDTTDG